MFIAELWINLLIATQWGWWKFLESPRRTYNKVIYYRDKILSTVEYLQGESAKWKALFTTVRLPYTILLSFGLSPQLAASVLIGGSVATTGVVAVEMIEPPSFSAGDAGVYNAPIDEPIFFEEKFNTLRLDLGTTPVGLVEITDTTLGTAYTGSALPTGKLT